MSEVVIAKRRRMVLEWPRHDSWDDQLDLVEELNGEWTITRRGEQVYAYKGDSPQVYEIPEEFHIYLE